MALRLAAILPDEFETVEDAMAAIAANGLVTWQVDVLDEGFLLLREDDVVLEKLTIPKPR